MMQIWEKRVSQGYDPDHPMGKELATRFNEDFAKLMEIVPGAGRRILVDMLDVIEHVNLECINSYAAGYRYATGSRTELRRDVLVERRPLDSSCSTLSPNRIQ